MKIKSGFVLNSVGEEHIVIAVEDRVKDFRGIIKLNPSGAFLWQQMTNECSEKDLCDALIEKYGISESLAKDSVSSFLSQLQEVDCFDNSGGL